MMSQQYRGRDVRLCLQKCVKSTFKPIGIAKAS